MDQNSTHGPRMDDELSKEVQSHLRGGPTGSRAEEWREPEPPGEDQPEPDAIIGDDRPGSAPAGMTTEQVDERSRLGRFIAGTHWPYTKDQLRENAENMEAPQDVRDAIERLPDKEYATIDDVWKALGHPTATERF
ncbi:MAG TPA: DUF2795 domain-containing protein [Micromonosporaceae bacterium]